MSAPISYINQITGLTALPFLASVVAVDDKDKITAVKSADKKKHSR